MVSYLFFQNKERFSCIRKKTLSKKKIYPFSPQTQNVVERSKKGGSVDRKNSLEKRVSLEYENLQRVKKKLLHLDTFQT